MTANRVCCIEGIVCGTGCSGKGVEIGPEDVFHITVEQPAERVVEVYILAPHGNIPLHDSTLLHPAECPCQTTSSDCMQRLLQEFETVEVLEKEVEAGQST